MCLSLHRLPLLVVVIGTIFETTSPAVAAWLTAASADVSVVVASTGEQLVHAINKIEQFMSAPQAQNVFSFG